MSTRSTNVKLLRFGPLVAQWGGGMGWFRLWGRGFAIKDTKRCDPLFSERNGYRGKWIGRFIIHYLPKSLTP